MTQKLSLGAAILLASLAAGPAVAVEPSGHAEKVSQAADATGTGGARVLDTEGAVFMGDWIRTNAVGEAQLRFADDTKFVIGPNARVEIDKFVFNSGGTAQTVTIDAVKGAFRFITGKSRKQAYTIRTPVMTIGVRGTGLDGFVEAGSGRSTLAVYEGEAIACNAGGECRTLTGGCSVVVVLPNGQFADPSPGTRGIYMPYSVSQKSLLADYQLDTSSCRGAGFFQTPPDAGHGNFERQYEELEYDDGIDSGPVSTGP